MKRFWLARGESVYGPYELAQLREMNQALELLDDDQLCQDGTENWVACPAWRERHCRTTATAKVSVKRPGQEFAQTHEGTVARCMHAINGGGPNARGSGHPLKYVRKDIVETVVDWLDRHHPRWQEDAWKEDADPSHAFDRWLVPAIAKLHPEAIKETYKCEFGPRKRWRTL